VCALALALSGCGGKKKGPDLADFADSESLEKLVTEVVADEDRRARALDLLSELDRTAAIYFQQVREVQFALAREAVAYDATDEDLEAIVGRLRAAREARRTDIVDLALEARTVLTAAEWGELSTRRMESLGMED
jgi:hypothetical protein